MGSTPFDLDGHDPLELRIHGIGDHHQWSSLGGARVLSGGHKIGLALVAPPANPDHRVRLFNWSRVTRRVFRSLWYLAFPFTLINVADHMKPDGRAHAWVHWILVRFAALNLTVLTTVWVLSAGEMIALMINRERIWGLDSIDFLRWASAAVLILIALWRALRSETATHRLFSVLHASLIATVSVVVDVVKPAQIILSLDSFFLAHAWYGPNGAGYDQIAEYWRQGPTHESSLRLEQYPFLDALGLVSYVSVFSVLAGVAIVTIIATRKDEGSAPLIGSAVCVALSVLLGLLTLTAVFRSLPAALGLPLTWLPAGQGFGDPELRTSLLPQYGRSMPNLALPLVALALILALVGVFALRVCPTWLRPAIQGVAWRLRRRPIEDGAQAQQTLLRVDRMRRWHILVTRKLPIALHDSLLLFIAFVYIIAFLLIEAFMDRVERDQAQWFIEWQGSELISASAPTTLVDRGISIGSAAAVALGFWILTRGAAGPLRSILASTGDVAGFWPITVSPFGGRSYRNTVVEKMTEILDYYGRNRVVLVGHSQGSVLAAWSVQATAPTVDATGSAREEESASVRALITCGSPIRSLYCRFFPRYFNSDFIERVQHGCDRWENFWRFTDPIATALGPGSSDHKLADPDREGDGTPKGHADYWNDRKQMRTVNSLVTGGEL